MQSPSDAPIRLAFCITELDPGGAERAFVQIVTGLDRTCWEPHVFCLGPRGDLAIPLEAAGIPVRCFGVRRWWQLGRLWQLVRELRALRPALLQTFLYHANIVGRVCGRLAGVPHMVAGIRVAERRSRFRIWLDRITSGTVEAHVCVSQAVARFSIEEGGLPADRVVVIPNGVAADIYAEAAPADLSEFGFAGNELVVLSVGRLDPQKNPQLLLRAFRQVRQQVPAARLLLVGAGGLERELQAIIQNDPLLAGSVHLCGFRADVPRLMRAADVFVLSSRWEGMPNVVLEAMAAGLPAVATDVEGVAELLGESAGGLIVPSDDTDVLATGLIRLLASGEERTVMSQNMQHAVKERFTWEAVVSAYEGLYRRILSQTAK
ncbi:MAG: glycosyltransferase [Planctomycetaceae bacterium]|nr:glycosyltransferase [Planctomycetaceae bacterium]